MNIQPSITTDELGVKGIKKNEEQPFKHVMKGAFDYRTLYQVIKKPIWRHKKKLSKKWPLNFYPCEIKSSASGISF